MDAQARLAIYRAELRQYVLDLEMWVTTTGSEYPARRKREVMARIEELECASS